MCAHLSYLDCLLYARATLYTRRTENKETSEKGVSISERWLWIYEKKHTWVCKGKILLWSLGWGVQENFDLLTSFIHDSADKHMTSKTSRSVSSIPLITPEIRRKIRRRNKTHAMAKKIGSSKLRSKFETLRREIKADVRKQHDLYVNNLTGDVKANPKDFYRYINSQKKKTPKVFYPWKRRMERVLLGPRKGRGIQWSVYGWVQ